MYCIYICIYIYVLYMFIYTYIYILYNYICVYLFSVQYITFSVIVPSLPSIHLIYRFVKVDKNHCFMNLALQECFIFILIRVKVFSCYTTIVSKSILWNSFSTEICAVI